MSECPSGANKKHLYRSLSLGRFALIEDAVLVKMGILKDLYTRVWDISAPDSGRAYITRFFGAGGLVTMEKSISYQQ